MSEQILAMALVQHSQADTSNVMILGAAGFIGRHLTSRLISSEIVATLTVAGLGVSQAFSGQRLSIREGIVNRQLLDHCIAPKVIYFLAGGASVDTSVQDPRGDFNLSLPPLVDLLDKMRQDWVGAHLIYISSAAVYGSMGSRATSIGRLPNPISPYGLHKMLSEQLISFECERAGLTATVLRPFSIYGPGLRKQLLWDALRKAELGDFEFYGSGNETRDWVFVSDFIELLHDVGTQPMSFPRVFNVGSGIGVSVSWILHKLFTIGGYINKPTFLGSVKPGNPSHLIADADEQAVCRKYLVTPLEEGLQRYVNWYSSLK